MQVIYSIGAKLGLGIGYTSLKAIQSIRNKGYLMRSISLDDININTNNPLLKDSTFDVFASILMDKPFDLLHFWNNFGYCQILKAHKLGAKTICERASSHTLNQYKILKEEYNIFGMVGEPIQDLTIKKSLAEFKESDYVAVPSDFVYNSFIEQKFPEEKLIKIPYGVDTEKYRPNKEPHEKIRIIFIGENWLRKGLIYVEKAVSELNLGGIELVVRANAPKFKELNYSSITRMGFVKSLPELYSSCDIMVFPTLEEGNALCVGEALASGLPVITTTNAGVWSDFKDGEHGFIVPIRDVEALKEKIMYFYDNLKEIHDMGKKARQLAEKHTWEKYGEELTRKYGELV